MMIRQATAVDRAALYDICLRTGDAGQDASARYTDPALLGHVWVGPYLQLEQSLAFVVEDADGVAGYVLGALDTAAFEERCERAWWPGLRTRYPDPGAVPAMQRTPDQELEHMIHHPPSAPRGLTSAYPSHLHIDLLPRTQGRGYGRRLMHVLLAALRSQGSRGVHLGTSRRNARAVGFYRHLGFTELASPDATAVQMGLPLSS